VIVHIGYPVAQGTDILWPSFTDLNPFADAPDSLIGKKYSKDAFMKGVNGLIDCEAKKW
jgi:hypothetical protein